MQVQQVTADVLPVHALDHALEVLGVGSDDRIIGHHHVHGIACRTGEVAGCGGRAEK